MRISNRGAVKEDVLLLHQLISDKNFPSLRPNFYQASLIIDICGEGPLLNEMVPVRLNFISPQDVSINSDYC